MSSNNVSSVEAEMCNITQRDDLFGVGSWANGYRPGDNLPKATDSDNAGSGDLKNQHYQNGSGQNETPMVRWLNEDKKAGPWTGAV